MPSKVLYFSYVCSVVLGCLCFQLRLSCLLVKLLLNFLSVCVHCIMRGVSDVVDIKNGLPYHFSSSGTKSIPKNNNCLRKNCLNNAWLCAQAVIDFIDQQAFFVRIGRLSGVIQKKFGRKLT